MSAIQLHLKKALSILAVSLCLGLMGCVIQPENGQWVSPHEPIDFRGYAVSPGVTVEVQAWHKVQRRWVTIASTTSGSAVQRINGDPLYPWSTSVLFSEIADYSCYWGSDTRCGFPPGSAQARTRVMQRDGQDFLLPTFEDDDCIIDRYSDGVGGYGIGVECASPESPVITLNVLT